MSEGKQEPFSLKRTLVQAATVLVVVGTVGIWCYSLKLGLSGIYDFYEEGRLTFFKVFVNFILSAILLGLYVAGLVLLHRRRTDWGTMFLFALLGFFVWFMRVPTIVYVEDAIGIFGEGRARDFHDILSLVIWPAIFVVLYVAGLVLLHRRQKGLAKILAFALLGLIVWFFVMPIGTIKEIKGS